MTHRYFYLDTEFTGFEGHLLSLALVHDRDDYLYLVAPVPEIAALRSSGMIDPWVEENVIPILYSVPEGMEATVAVTGDWGELISDFIYGRDQVPQIIADWPEDLLHFNKLLLTGPGKAVHMDNQTHMTCVRHIDVYPTELEGAVQHNALWDALAIKKLLEA